MDTTTFVKKLKEIFIERNRGEKKYSQVWLSKIDLDGLYHSQDFVLRLKAFTIKDFFNETLEIIRLLNEKAKEEAKHIPRVSVYDVKESAHPESDDIIIYEDASVLTY
jgi:hypothetical protein